mmetsp:Transcript_89585/g.175355  ORF Transcript_89585/g.175355 Transcript_89585/m.175355 type:complete len:253 (-) Transcript_89585:713-1471(-)
MLVARVFQALEQRRIVLWPQVLHRDDLPTLSAKLRDPARVLRRPAGGLWHQADHRRARPEAAARAQAPRQACGPGGVARVGDERRHRGVARLHGLHLGRTRVHLGKKRRATPFRQGRRGGGGEPVVGGAALEDGGGAVHPLERLLEQAADHARGGHQLLAGEGGEGAAGVEELQHRQALEGGDHAGVLLEQAAHLPALALREDEALRRGGHLAPGRRARGAVALGHEERGPPEARPHGGVAVQDGFERHVDH